MANSPENLSVLVVEVGGTPEFRTIVNTPDEMYKIIADNKYVHKFIDKETAIVIYPFNQDTKRPNRKFVSAGGLTPRGTFIVIGWDKKANKDNGAFCDLSAEQLTKYHQELQLDDDAPAQQR